jgi:hypothetical protein
MRLTRSEKGSVTERCVPVAAMHGVCQAQEISQRASWPQHPSLEKTV